MQFVTRFTKREGQLLVGQLDMVLQGMSEAVEAMEHDPATFETIEDFMEASAQAVEDLETIKDIRERIAHELE